MKNIDQMTVLRKMRYKETFIYIMQFGYVFQYIFSFNGEIYQDYATLKPSLMRRFLFKIGRVSSLYTGPELEEGEKVMLSGALDSIEKLIDEGQATRQGKKHKEQEIEKISAKIVKQTGKKCQWQATETDKGFYYQCLTHGHIVKMIEGEKPTHETVIPEL